MDLGARVPYGTSYSIYDFELQQETCIDDGNFRQEAVEELKQRDLDFLPFPDLEEAVKKDVDFIRSTKLVPESVTISGWVYEVETGKTRRVV